MPTGTPRWRRSGGSRSASSTAATSPACASGSSTSRRLGVNLIYLTPFFPAGSSHRYDAADVRPRRPGARRRRRARRPRRRRPRPRHQGDRRPHDEPLGQPPRMVPGGAWPTPRRRRRGSTSSPSIRTATSGGSTCRRCRSSTCDPMPCGSALVAGPDSVAGRWLDGPSGLDGWRIDVGNMTGRHRSIDVNHDVFHDVRRTMAAVRPDGWLVAEHMLRRHRRSARRRLARDDGVHVVHAAGVELAVARRAGGAPPARRPGRAPADRRRAGSPIRSARSPPACRGDR